MEPSNHRESNGTDAPRYIDFPCLEYGTLGADSQLALNRWSSTITRGKKTLILQLEPR
jgi:hypothetical protein